MRGLVFTTAAVIALGLGTAAPGHAQGYPSKPSGTSSPTAATSQMPSTGIGTATMTRSQIKQAQTKLRAQGLYRGPIDGKIGRGTRLALERFQKHNGLHVTARLDRSTMARLIGARTSGQGSSMPPRHAVQMTPRSTKTPSQAGSSLPQTKPQTKPSGGGSGSSLPPKTGGGTAGSNAGGMQQNQQK
jgi:putative peptidoglycan binding protein